MEKLATALLIILLPIIVLLTSYSAFNDKEPPSFEVVLEIFETFPVLDNVTESIDDLKIALSGFPTSNNTQGLDVLEMVGMFFTSIWNCIVSIFSFLLAIINDFMLLMSWAFSLFSYL